MTPKRIDVTIICNKCQEPISGADRQMDHDHAAGEWVYTVSHHGAQDKGKHLRVPADESSHGKILVAFPNEPAEVPLKPIMPPPPLPQAMPQPGAGPKSN